jgi:hypothetical protein
MEDYTMLAFILLGIFLLKKTAARDRWIEYEEYVCD